jgi:hypothetical protein
MMTRHLIVACIVYLALVLQPSLSSDLASIPMRPWLPGIALAACLSLIKGSGSLIWAAILGLGVDGQSVEQLGVHLILATLIATMLLTASGDLLRFHSHSFSPPGVIITFVGVFSATFVWRFAASVIHSHFDRHTVTLDQIAWSACYVGIGSAVVASVAIMAVRLMASSLHGRQATSVALDNQWNMLTDE